MIKSSEDTVTITRWEMKTAKPMARGAKMGRWPLMRALLLSVTANTVNTNTDVSTASLRL